ncbi:hypothetical protein SRHO_G00208140 [Serrasalmus rhombeus]
MLGQILGLLYAGIQVLLPCLPPTPLSSQSLLTHDKYLGDWYFVGVAAFDKESIAAYMGIDNSVAKLHKASDSSLLMTAALHQGDECKVLSWTYKVSPASDPIMKEGEQLGLAFDGKWVNCDSCLLLMKIDLEKGNFRIMLFARSQESREELLKSFKSKMECLEIDEFIIPPQEKEFCKLDAAA